MRLRKFLTAGSHRAEFGLLRDLVASHRDLQLEEWYALHDLVMRFRPDLILELGRGYGNSTVVLVDAANQVRARVVSVGNDVPPAWENETRPKIQPRLGNRWFEPLTVLQGQIEDTDLGPWLLGSRRSVLFWDAHGNDLAEYIVSALLPSLPSPSLVVVHDMYSRNEGDRLRSEYDEVFEYAGLVSPYAELPVIGAYLNRHGLAHEQAHSLIWFELPK